MKTNPKCDNVPAGMACNLTDVKAFLCTSCREYIEAAVKPETLELAKGLGMPEHEWQDGIKPQPKDPKATGLVKAIQQEGFSKVIGSNDIASTGKKHDKSKVRMELLSGPALVGLSHVLTFGAQKYAVHNWRKGFDWSRLLGAAMRHLIAFQSGEDIDPESGLPHIDHLACCVMFLSEHQKVKLGTDDRHTVDFGSMDYEPKSQ